MTSRLLILLFYLFITNISSGQDMLLMDKQLKNPPQYANEFNANLFFKNKFPIYTSEIQMIKQNADELARMLDRFNLKTSHQDTLYAGHSKFIFFNQPKGYANEFTVILSTRVDKVELNLTIIQQEHNKRNAQLKLLGLVDYLSSHILTASR